MISFLLDWKLPRNAVMPDGFRRHADGCLTVGCVNCGEYEYMDGKTPKEAYAANWQRMFAENPADKTVYVINGRGAGTVTLRLNATPVKAEAFDTFGTSVPVPKLEKGVQGVAIPVSGYLKLPLRDSLAMANMLRSKKETL